jgi:hypothetical protein
MNKIAVSNKISQLETQIKLLKIATSKQPDFNIDEKNWTKIKPSLKKFRTQVFKETYG